MSRLYAPTHPLNFNQAISVRAPPLILQGQITEPRCRRRWEPRERITIVEDVVAEIDIASTNLLAVTKRNNPKLI